MHSPSAQLATFRRSRTTSLSVFRDVIHDERAYGPAVVCARNGTVTLLPGGIPNLRLDVLSLYGHLSSPPLTDRGWLPLAGAPSGAQTTRYPMTQTSRNRLVDQRWDPSSRNPPQHTIVQRVRRGKYRGCQLYELRRVERGLAHVAGAIGNMQHRYTWQVWPGDAVPLHRRLGLLHPSRLIDTLHSLRALFESRSRARIILLTHHSTSSRTSLHVLWRS